jgi:hypothetical protein
LSGGKHLRRGKKGETWLARAGQWRRERGSGGRERKGARTDRLGISVHILLPSTSIRLLIVRNIINLPLINKSLIDRPRRVFNNLIAPLDVAYGLVAFRGGEDWVGLVFADEGGGTDADEEVDGGEGELALAELEHVAVCKR